MSRLVAITLVLAAATLPRPLLAQHGGGAHAGGGGHFGGGGGAHFSGGGGGHFSGGGAHFGGAPHFGGGGMSGFRGYSGSMGYGRSSGYGYGRSGGSFARSPMSGYSRHSYGSSRAYFGQRSVAPRGG